MAATSERPLALVTGASSGIGFELAKQFAQHGFDLVIAAEDDELQAATRELEAAGAGVDAVQVDLTSEDGVRELYSHVQRASRPLEAAALNAGLGAGGAFASDTDLDQELEIVDLNVRSTVQLAKYVVRDMTARGRGRILFTSSIASTTPGPFQAVYNASKSFVQSFALALRSELRNTGVTVTSLMPGPTDTEFFNRAHLQDTRLGSGPKDDPAEVAREGFEALMAGRERVLSRSLMTKAQGIGSRILPDSIKAELHRFLAAPGSAGSGGASRSDNSGGSMSTNSLSEQLIKYLTDAHSIEVQALVQMKAAPKLAGDPEMAAIFERHRVETEEHERLVDEQLRAHGGEPSKIKDIAGKVTGHGFGMFAAANPDTPGKLIVHAYSYEHMEEAAYDLLARMAERAGDQALEQTARRIEAQEREMGDRVAGCFDRAAELSLAKVPREDLQAQLGKYLADTHAIENQSLALLDKGSKMAVSGELAAVLQEHHTETQEHQRQVAARLEARGQSPSALKDAALKLGALNWGAFFAAQPDTPAKLAAFAYAVEHLEAGAYEMLGRVAERAGDSETVAMAARILEQERAAAEKVRALFDEAVTVTLAEQVSA